MMTHTTIDVCLRFNGCAQSTESKSSNIKKKKIIIFSSRKQTMISFTSLIRTSIVDRLMTNIKCFVN